MSGERVYLIAEAGVNHNGSLERALAMIDAAASAGADAVKFQTFKADKVISRYAAKAPYQVDRTGPEQSQLDMVRALELSADEHAELAAHCRSKGIDYLSTPFDEESVRNLAALRPRYMKVPSGEVTDLPLLRVVGSAGIPVILSTGMATLDEVRSAIDALVDAGADRERMRLLHCTTEYPAPYEETNLLAMLTMREEFDLPVGLSDHTLGSEVACAAVALDATVIEKHFTLDRGLPGPDHAASLDPVELGSFIRAVRHVEAAMGDGVKGPTQSERGNMIAARRSIVASRLIRAGEVYTAENLTTKRPSGGIDPMRWDEVLGNVAPRDFEQDEQVTL